MGQVVTVHDWLNSLEFGKRYYKPPNETWHSLEYHINESRQYRRKFEGYRLHRLRGDMFCLKCTHCGSID